MSTGTGSTWTRFWNVGTWWKALLLVAGRLGELFAPQRPRGGAWMRPAVALVVLPIPLRLVGTNRTSTFRNAAGR